MDFIERHLGFSPDNGDGSMEVVLITVFVMIVAMVAFRLASKVTAPKGPNFHANVRYWHLADMGCAPHMSANDPKRTSCGHAGAPTCVRFGLGGMRKKDHVSSINNCANT